jgi:predicted O-linked N-acetylglucosamine transferase (SPINDLY family)
VAAVSDLPGLAALRAGLREQVRTSPLCDAPRFGRNLGTALRHTWRAWCAEQAG